MSESDFKRHFKLSVRAQGGAVFSLSPEHQAGLPDMYLLMPGFMPILVEAKFLKVPVGKTFNKRILYSAYQGRLLQSCWDMQPGSVWGLIGFKTKEYLFYSCLIPGNCDRLTNQIFSDGIYHGVRHRTTLFDIKSMMKLLGLELGGIYARPREQDTRSAKLLKKESDYIEHTKSDEFFDF